MKISRLQTGLRAVWILSLMGGLGCSSDDGQELLRAAELAHKRGKLNDALAILERITKEDAPDSPAVARAKSHAVDWLVAASDSEALYEERRNLLRAALQWKPASGVVYSRLCAVDLDEEKFEDLGRCLTLLMGMQDVPLDEYAKMRATLDSVRAKADEETRNGIEVACITLLRAFLSDRDAANRRYLNKRVRTVGPIEDATWADRGNLELCHVGSDAERQVSSILCKFSPATTSEEVRAGLKSGSTVRVAGVVDKFVGVELDDGTMSQLSISPCEIVR